MVYINVSRHDRMCEVEALEAESSARFLEQRPNRVLIPEKLGTSITTCRVLARVENDKILKYGSSRQAWIEFTPCTHPNEL